MTSDPYAPMMADIPTCVERIADEFKQEWQCPKCGSPYGVRDLGKADVQCLSCEPDDTLLEDAP